MRGAVEGLRPCCVDQTVGTTPRLAGASERLNYPTLGCIAVGVAVAPGTLVAEGRGPLMTCGMEGVVKLAAGVPARCCLRADAYAARHGASEPTADCAVGTSLVALAA